MSAQPTQPRPGQPPPATGLTLNLASNNPFRNLSTSPVTGGIPGGSKPDTPTSPFDDPIPPRPVSRNPFLDPLATKAPPLRSPGVMSTQSDKGPEPTAEEIFGSLAIEEKKPSPAADDKRPMDRPPGPPGPPRGGGMMRGRGRGGPLHRPTRSQEEAMRARKMHPSGGPPRPGGPSTSPKRMERRPRRNSDSSLLDSDKPNPEEEKKAREARRKERERRHREGKDKPRTNRKLDIIDQLDATSIFGTGAFHHDGPFDACNPHRNRKGSRRAPMKAFAEDSLNNSIGGSGPLKDRPDHARLMGTADGDASKDFAGSGIKNKAGYNLPNPSRGELPLFDPLSRGSIMYGDESMGLGTTTFLEGTPAARTAIQKREQEQARDNADGGLQRKKSLAQRIRSINRGPPSGRITNPEGVYGRRSPEPQMPPATSMAAIGGAKAQEPNPFFSEFSNEPETITVKRTNSGEAPNTKSPTSPPSTHRSRGFSVGIERRATTDVVTAGSSSPEDGLGKTGRGILGRVKSLKGGRKARNVSGDASAGPPPAATTANPGTAV